tara:strand:- start:509 stop:703 length:195 start_codon:yes stop_codon:yes gene_type:complete
MFFKIVLGINLDLSVDVFEHVIKIFDDFFMRLKIVYDVCFLGIGFMYVMDKILFGGYLVCKFYV